MFDFAWSEFALIGIVALLFIGPKDMPAAIRTVSNVVKKGRKLAGEFQGHVEEMVREADLGEARDQLRQLRSFNVRGQLMRALDSDGSMRQLAQQKPADLLASGPRPVPAMEGPKPLAADGIVQPPQYRPDPAPLPVADYGWTTPEEAAKTEAEREAADPAPRILPPRIARRLRSERAAPHAPAFLPPRPRHADPAIIPPRRR